MTRSPASLRRSVAPSLRRCAPAYTLTEVLVVIAVIVLLLATSVPVFKALTGNRSVDAAANVVGGALGEARAEAIALQKVTGLFFFQDRVTQRINAALVRSNGQTSSGTFTFHLLDLVPDRDFFTLPPGVGIQFLDNCDVNRSNVNAPRNDDGYIGLNKHQQDPNTYTLQYGGVILFDPRGQLISLNYAFDFQTIDSTGTAVQSPICRLFNDKDRIEPATDVSFIPPNNNPNNNFPPPQSQFGFVLYDAENFKSINLSPDDPQLAGRNYDNNEQQEERWLDDNALPFLVNRYNGTLIRGE